MPSFLTGLLFSWPIFQVATDSFSLQSTCPARFCFFPFPLPIIDAPPSTCPVRVLSISSFPISILFPFSLRSLFLSWVFFFHFFFSSIPVLTPFTLSLLWACFHNFRFVLHLSCFFFFCGCVFILYFPFLVWVFVDGFLFCFLLAQFFVLYFASFSFSALCM